MEQENSSSTPSDRRTPALSSTAILPHRVRLPNSCETITVAFRQAALHHFLEYFKPLEREHVLEILVDQAAGAAVIEEASGICLKELRIFSVRFRFVDLSFNRCILVESLHKDGEDSPPPSQTKSMRDPAVSGAMSGFIRWVLDGLFGKLFCTDSFVFPLASDLHNPGLLYVRGEAARGAPDGGDVTLHVIFDVSASKKAGTKLDRDWALDTLMTILASEGDMKSKPSTLNSDLREAPFKTGTKEIHGEVLTTFEVPISRTVDVKAIRAKLGMTQERFASTFGLSLASLRNWEQGTRTPERPIAMYLRLIDRFPDDVRREVEAMRLLSREDV